MNRLKCVLLYMIYVLVDTKWCLGSINSVKQSMNVLFKEENDELFSVILLKQPCMNMVFVITL